jgi:hypothetical protein
MAPQPGGGSLTVVPANQAHQPGRWEHSRSKGLDDVLHDPTPRRLHVGRLRGACRAQQWDLRRVLVHRLPPGVRPEGDQLSRGQRGPGSGQVALTPRSSSTRTAPHRDGASTAAPRNSLASSTSASMTRTRRLILPGGSPASTSTRNIAARHRTCGAGRRCRPDRPCRGPRRGHLRGDRRPRGAGPFPVQRDRRTLRAVRIYPRPAGWQARRDREQGGRSGASVRYQASTTFFPIPDFACS